MKTQKVSLREKKKNELLNLIFEGSTTANKDKVLISFEGKTEYGTVFNRGEVMQIINHEGYERCVAPLKMKSPTDCIWVREGDIVKLDYYNRLLKIVLSGRLRESCSPLAVKGIECAVDDNEYININNVLYLHSDYYFDLI